MGRAAAGFGLPSGSLVALGGATGSTWGAGEVVVRVGEPARLDREVLAMTAAAAVLPVPVVLDRQPGALLLRRLPGGPAATSSADPVLVGTACAGVHAALAEVTAPPELGPGSLLHLDLHPFNVLVDDAGVVTGVLDWARTWSILTLDPDAVAFRRDPRADAVCAAWCDGLGDLPDASLVWACERMLGDLAHRHPAARLAPVREFLSRRR